MEIVTRCDIHNHTRYSNLRLRDALPTPEQLIDKAIELGLKGISISDHETVAGHVKANQYAKEIKEKHPDFKVILGNEIYLVNERPTKTHYHYVLTALDKEGYHQIKELSSRAWLNSYTDALTRVDTLKEDLERIITRNPGHIVASTACVGGELGKMILMLDKAERTGNKEEAEFAHNEIVNFVLWNKNIFNDNFYIEVQPGVSKEQIIVNKRLASIAKCFDVKMIATSDTHYLRPEDRYVHKNFLNSEEKEREVDAFYQDAFLHSNEEMIEKFKASDFDEDFVLEMFKNSMEIYEKVQDFSLFHTQQVPEVDVRDYPFNNKISEELKEKYPILSELFVSNNKVERYWVNVCYNKLSSLNKNNDKYLERLEEEADVKRVVGARLETNMFSYPVCLAHYIQMMWDCGSLIGAGRGSACSALNHYLLGITQLDPLEWDFPFFRYMNRDTDGLGDIDIDVCPSKVSEIVSKISKERGQNFAPEYQDPLYTENLGAVYVCTFGTESTKSAIQTAARGYRSEECPDGIDADESQYISSLVPLERGFVWSLNDMIYGNKEKDRKPSQTFLAEVNKYPGLLDAMIGIEGCISRRGRHASGVLFTGRDPFEFTAYMKTPSGEIVSQYDLHDVEWCGGVKMDILVTEVQDKIAEALRLLQENGEIEKNLSLKEVYDKYLHPDVLPIDNSPKTWKAIQDASVLDLFQLDSDIGRQGAKKVKPDNIVELSSTNGLIRLMTTEKGAETWLDKYARFKKDIRNLEEERTIKYNLTKEECGFLDKYLKATKGIGISQEQMMRVLMDKDICGCSLKEANKFRKIVSKKKMSEIPKFKEYVFNNCKSLALSNYVWDYVVAPGLGYSFSDIHSVSYSFVGYQTAHIATKWNQIYWNTACLIVNSGSLDENTQTGDKEKSTDYAKVAKALGDIINKNIKVTLVDINKSDYSFKPDVNNNQILFGMKALGGINGSVIEQIICGRPYLSFKDFLNRVHLNKTAMISLIKSGAFDSLEEEWAKELNIEPRVLIMIYYLSLNCDAKKKITLQNFNGLISKDLVPQDLAFEKRVYNFNKQLKNNKVGKYYVFDYYSYEFYSKVFELDYLEVINGQTCILCTKWDKIYKTVMDSARDWIKKNHNQILIDYNRILFKEAWDKYAEGNISAWEMESLCFYYHKHELADIDVEKYGISDFAKLPTTPEVDYFFKRNGKDIPIYKTHKIIGTVIKKDDTRSSISILTTTGVANVKFTKEYYAMYARQISERMSDGTKKVVEKGWFQRGTKVMITGFRRDDQFVAKTYANTLTHQLYKIDVTNNGKDMELTHERYKSED